jgi:hypothetical protein
MASMLLADARELVSRGWCQGAEAEDERGGPVVPWSADARRWSALGALVATAGGPDALVNGGPSLERVATAALALGLAAGVETLKEWNDAPERTRAEVLAVFDRAVRLAEAA